VLLRPRPPSFRRPPPPSACSAFVILHCVSRPRRPPLPNLLSPSVWTSFTVVIACRAPAPLRPAPEIPSPTSLSDLLRPLRAQDAPPPPSQSSSLPPSSVCGLSHSMAWIWMVLVAAVVLLCRVVLCGPERAVHAPLGSDRRSRNMLLIVPHPDDKSMSVDLPRQNRFCRSSACFSA
jgi:hypothetical protein